MLAEKIANQLPRQLHLFGPTMHAYASGEPLANKDLYTRVAEYAGIDPALLEHRVPVGASGQQHSVIKHRCRWIQQSLRRARIIEHVPGERGIWQLTRPAGRDLSQL